jgi:hypothetical protein
MVKSVYALKAEINVLLEMALENFHELGVRIGFASLNS